MRDLAVTENISVDGVLDGDFFVRAGETTEADDIDDALRDQRERADALLLGRVTFDAFRGYWPQQTDDPSGTSEYLDRVAKYVVSTYPVVVGEGRPLFTNTRSQLDLLESRTFRSGVTLTRYRVDRR